MRLFETWKIRCQFVSRLPWINSKDFDVWNLHNLYGGKHSKKSKKIHSKDRIKRQLIVQSLPPPSLPTHQIIYRAECLLFSGHLIAVAKNYRSVILAAKRPKVGLHGSLVLVLSSLILVFQGAFAFKISRFSAHELLIMFGHSVRWAIKKGKDTPITWGLVSFIHQLKSMVGKLFYLVLSSTRDPIAHVTLSKTCQENGSTYSQNPGYLRALPIPFPNPYYKPFCSFLYQFVLENNSCYPFYDSFPK